MFVSCIIASLSFTHFKYFTISLTNWWNCLSNSGLQYVEVWHWCCINFIFHKAPKYKHPLLWCMANGKVKLMCPLRPIQPLEKCHQGNHVHQLTNEVALLIVGKQPYCILKCLRTWIGELDSLNQNTPSYFFLFNYFYDRHTVIVNCV